MLHFSKKNKSVSLCIATLAIIFVGYYFLPTKTEAEKVIPVTEDIRTEIVEQETKKRERYVLVNLKEKTITTYDNGDIRNFPLISQGKPGSYYETIGGEYLSDYKEPVHFSSIGHVYMPHSIHIFGNYFIHGIPYYEDGTKVSSAYSGGCVRVQDDNALYLYNFIDKKTPIIITREGLDAFVPTKKSNNLITSESMTRLMVAIISLETLTQDSEIIDTDESTTTRKTILKRLLKNKDTSVGLLYASFFGEEYFIEIMNKKATILGLTNTTFKDITSPAETTTEDLKHFMDHISIYKSFLLQDFVE